jgi:butyrate kinase
MPTRIFVINPGSSSIKVALFEDGREVFSVTRRHTPEELAPFPSVYEQRHFRLGVILAIAKEQGLDLATVDAFAGRGGFLAPVASGTYAVNDKILDDVVHCRYGEHASSVSPVVIDLLSKRYGKPAYVTDPVSVDEFRPEAYMTGIPGVRRMSRFHALNQKAVGRLIAGRYGKAYRDLNLIIAHLGGGVSVGAHRKGRVVDACNPSDEGPMSIDRPGNLPNTAAIELCYAEPDKEAMKRKFAMGGGVMAYTGESDLIKIEARAASEPDVALVLDTMAYQIAFWMLGCLAAFDGEPCDALVLTGGMAKSDYVVPRVAERLKPYGRVEIVRGEYEMEALAEGALEVLNGERELLVYGM